MSRDGVVIGEQGLDANDRTLQALAVEGGGGVYRLEVTEVVAGSRSHWTEICVSELQVVGRAQGAQATRHFPRWATGALPAARPAVGQTPSDEVKTAFLGSLRELERNWARYESERAEFDMSTGVPEPSSGERARWARWRRASFLAVAAIADHVDGALADELRRTIVAPLSWERFNVREDTELAKLAGGMDAIVTWLDDDAARCAWARAHTHLRLVRLDGQAAVDVNYSQSNDWEHFTPEERRRSRHSEQAFNRVHGLVLAWDDSLSATTRRALALRSPGDYLADEFAALHEAAGTAQATCP